MEPWLVSRDSRLATRSEKSMNDISISLDDLYAVLQPWLAAITGLDPSVVIQGLPNRASMPPATPGFISMTDVSKQRLNYNIVTYDTIDPDPTQINIETHWKIGMQLDVYGPTAFDMAGIIEGLWFSGVGVVALKPTCSPLYTDPSHQAPLTDSEEQYERHYVVTAYLQYNPVITSPQQFANVGRVNNRNVYATFPPGAAPGRARFRRG